MFAAIERTSLSLRWSSSSWPAAPRDSIARILVGPGRSIPPPGAGRSQPRCRQSEQRSAASRSDRASPVRSSFDFHRVVLPALGSLRLRLLRFFFFGRGLPLRVHELRADPKRHELQAALLRSELRAVEIHVASKYSESPRLRRKSATSSLSRLCPCSEDGLALRRQARQPQRSGASCELVQHPHRPGAGLVEPVDDVDLLLQLALPLLERRHLLELGLELDRCRSASAHARLRALDLIADARVRAVRCRPPPGSSSEAAASRTGAGRPCARLANRK